MPEMLLDRLQGFGGLDGMAFIYHWMGISCQRLWTLFGVFLPAGNGWLSKAIVAVLIIGLSAINFFGVKPGARTINYFTVGKLLSLLIFIGVGFFFIQKASTLVPFY